ncbi:MAG TPA: hypothetical protein VFY29_20125 [Terriglobia bacterium]|nr:hypothetical protein [Terriglobia bacterium]
MQTLTFKVTDDEARTIRAQARKEGITVSDYLRRRARMSMAVSKTPRKVRCSHTGAMIFGGLDDRRPLTTDSVRELLADFP